jgi:eukaryotic-like serine/threonine-protein kinase
MTTAAGSHVGPYEILARVGAGGMGEVFRARDTRLGRTVAIKMLPASVAGNAHLRTRLQREAKAISSLSHPNICALYDIGESNGVDYLVMEFLEGEPLSERLSRGPLSLDEALRYAIQIAGALEIAHREGIIHRDLKPGNVMLTKSGAKLLDFGLARTEVSTGISADAPTVQHRDEPLTAEGTIVGTFQYMAPEQLEGMPADARTDIFAFGTLLYEMVTGRRAFAGKTRTSLIAAIVAASPPPISTLRPVAPASLDHIVQRCLEKDPDARWQSVHDIRLELEWIARQAEMPAARIRSRLTWLPWFLSALTMAAALAFLVSRSGRTEDLPHRTHILPPKDLAFYALMDSLSVSPDGQYVTYRVDRDDRLWLRPLRSLEAKPIEGTEGADFPFWSPDSRWIGFFTDNKLKKVGLNGVPPVTLCDAGRGRTGTWNRHGVILFSPTPISGLHRVAASGGPSQPLTSLDVSQKETTHRWPIFLPDGKRFLYLAGTHTGTKTSDLNAVYLSSLDAPQKRKLILRARSNVIYTKGHLLYVKDNLLVAHPFDPKDAELSGEPFRVAERVEYDAEFFRGAFDATPEGLLIYRMASSPPLGRLAWVDKGVIGEPFGTSFASKHVRLSPDQKKVAASIVDPATGLTDLWVIDTSDGRMTALTSTTNAGEQSPVWSPDSARIIFSRHAGFASGGNLVVIAADGSAPEHLIHSSALEALPSSWSPDGRFVLFDLIDDKGAGRRSDIMILPMEGGPPRPFIRDPSRSDRQAYFSPTGDAVVYLSSDGGPAQAYVTNFPSATPKVPFSSEKPFDLRWSGNDILVIANDSVLAVPVGRSGGRFIAGTPRKTLQLRSDIVNGEATTAERQIVVLRKMDVYEETVTVSTDWLDRDHK